MGAQQLPIATVQRCVACSKQREVDAVLVAADKPAPLAIQSAVVDVVFVTLFTWDHAAERGLRCFGVQHPGFAGGFAAQLQDQLAFGAAAVAAEKEAPIRFVEYQFGCVGAKAVAVEFVRAVGVVQLTEEQRMAVIGPGHAAVAFLERQLDQAVIGQLFDKQLVGFLAAGIQAVGLALMVRADAESAEGDKAAIGQVVGVEQQLFAGLIDRQRAIGGFAAAVMPRVFVSPPGGRGNKKKDPRRRA